MGLALELAIENHGLALERRRASPQWLVQAQLRLPNLSASVAVLGRVAIAIDETMDLGSGLETCHWGVPELEPAVESRH